MRKSVFKSPEKENKWPKSSSTLTSIQTFKGNWKVGSAWLRYDAKSELMFCDFFIKAQCQNIFTKGCSVFKKESVVKHIQNKGNSSRYLF